MISNESLFIVFNALVGFFSDIVLNIIAKHDIYKPITTLRPYFENKTTLQAAFYALLTVVIIVCIIMKIFQVFYNKYLPETKKEYTIYLILTFIIGYIGDILIYKLNIFPKLKEYYKVVGKGLWGALAILFSVGFSLLGLYIFTEIRKI
jgi:ABC-type bacteriocin/lantibiotic exporter with double-glycine peptidase domain